MPTIDIRPHMLAYAYAVKSGKCAVCGKRAKRCKEFTVHSNPLAKPEDRLTPEQAREIVNARRDKWLEEPVVHAKCERFMKE